MIWWIKILAKIVLSRVPLGYWAWRKVGMFRHGAMHKADYAIGVVSAHLARIGPDRISDAVCLELGPGDSLASALIARSIGARKIYLVDVGDFADRDIEVYRELARRLTEMNMPSVDLSQVDSVGSMLDILNAEYLTDGLRSLREIGTESVDLIWSQAVLEHIRLREVRPLFAELRRILRSDGAMSHRIDFQDHLGGSLNNLRFSDRVWESPLMANSGFYTNRMRSAEMLTAIEEAGFELTSVAPDRWQCLPLDRARLAQRFRGLAEEDLLTKGVDVVARPIAA